MKKGYKMLGGLLLAGGVVLSASAVGEAAVRIAAQETAVQMPVTGGWSVTEGSTALDAHTRKVFDQALDGLVGCSYEPVALLGKQLVAGMNYCVLCRLAPVVPNAQPQWGLVYIYEDLQGQARITRVEDLRLGDRSPVAVKESAD